MESGLIAIRTHESRQQMNKGKISELSHKELCTKQGEKLSLSAVLTDPKLFHDLFIHHEIIPAKRKASTPHSHSKKEEIVFVLSGAVRAHIGSTFTDLRVGEYMGFPPDGEKHFLENVSDQEATCLVVCSKPIDDQVEYHEPSKSTTK